MHGHLIVTSVYVCVLNVNPKAFEIIYISGAAVKP